MKIFFLLALMSLPLFGSECISGNCSNGFGTVIFENGQSYVGNFKNNNQFPDVSFNIKHK